MYKRQAYYNALEGWGEGQEAAVAVAVQNISEFDMDNLLVGAWIVDASNNRRLVHYRVCLLYTSDAADERSRGALGGRRIIKKKKQAKERRHNTIDL